MASTTPITVSAAISAQPSWTLNTTVYPLSDGVSGVLVGVEYVASPSSAFPANGYWVGKVYRNGITETIPYADLYSSSSARKTAFNAAIEATKLP